MVKTRRHVRRPFPKHVGKGLLRTSGELRAPRIDPIVVPSRGQSGRRHEPVYGNRSLVHGLTADASVVTPTGEQWNPRRDPAEHDRIVA